MSTSKHSDSNAYIQTEFMTAISRYNITALSLKQHSSMKWGDATGCLVPPLLVAMVERERVELERRQKEALLEKSRTAAEATRDGDADGGEDENVNGDLRSSPATKGRRSSGSNSKGNGGLLTPVQMGRSDENRDKGSTIQQSRKSKASVGVEEEPVPPLELPTQQFDGFDMRLYASVAAFLERLLYEKLMCAICQNYRNVILMM